METPDTTPQGTTGHRELEGLQEGSLSAWGATWLAMGLWGPAASLALGPVSVWLYAGNGAALAMLVTTIVMVCIAVCVIVFSRRYVVSGSLYSYMTHVFGRWAVIAMGAALALGWFAIAAADVPGMAIFGASWLGKLGVPNPSGLGTQAILTGLATLVGAILAYRGLDVSVRVTLVLVAVTFPTVAAITIAAAVHTGLHLHAQLSLQGVPFNGFALAIPVAATMLLAFEGNSALALETKNPKRTVPLIIVALPVGFGIMYVLASLLQVPAFNASAGRLNAGVSPLVVLADRGGLPFLGSISDLLIFVASFTIVVGCFNFVPRIWGTLAMDGLLPKRLAYVHPRFKTPTIGIVSLGILGWAVPVLLALVTGREMLTVYTWIATLIAFYWVIPYVLICAGAVVLLIRARQLNPLVLVAAVAGAGVMIWMFLDSLIHPAGSPLDLMPYVALGTLVILILAFALASRRHLAHGGTPEGGDMERVL